MSEVNGKIVGWIHVFYAPKLASESFYEIGGLAINPEFRGQGTGRSLVRYVLDNFKANYCCIQNNQVPEILKVNLR